MWLRVFIRVSVSFTVLGMLGPLGWALQIARIAQLAEILWDLFDTWESMSSTIEACDGIVPPGCDPLAKCVDGVGEITLKQSTSIELGSGRRSQITGEKSPVSVDNSDGCWLWWFACYQLKALMKFDLSEAHVPAGTVQKALLKIYTTSPIASNNPDVQMYRNVKDWNAASTWESFNAGQPDLSGGLTQSFKPEYRNTFVEIDVTRDVEYWYEGNPNLGWLFQTSSNDGWDFQTSMEKRNECANIPQLTIIYDCT